MIATIGRESRGVAQLIIALRRKGLMEPKVRLSAMPEAYVHQIPYGNPFVFQIAMGAIGRGGFWDDALMFAQERRDEWEQKVKSFWKLRGLRTRCKRVAIVVKGWDQYGCPTEETIYTDESLSAGT